MPWLASDLIDKAAGILQEDFGTNALWTRAELLKYVDGGVRDLAHRSGGVRRGFSLEAVNAQAAYSMDEAVTQVDYAAFASKEIFPVNLHGLELRSSTWDAETGTPIAYYHEILDLGRIGLYPAPTKAQVNVISISTGNWSAGATWDVGRVPRLYDVVTVDTPHTVTLDVHAICGFSASANALIVNGTLDASTNLTLSTLGNISVVGTFNPTGLIAQLPYGGDGSDDGDIYLLARYTPTAITAETDSIPLNPACEPVLLDYLLWMTYAQEGDGQELGKANHYREKFQQFSALLRKTLGGYDA